MVDVLLVGAEELENLATRYLAALLRQHGFTVVLASFSTAAERGAVLQQARRCRPRLVGLSVIFQYRAPEFMALAGELRPALPQAHITAGGHFPSFAAAELLRDFAALDSVVRGEGELTLLELMQKLDRPREWGSILGLSYRRLSEECRPGEHTRWTVVDNPPRPLIADLDTLPFPARDSPPQRHLGIGFSPIVGSRGCYRDCSFCSIHAFYAASAGAPQRFRSVPNLVDEMEQLYRRHGVRFFVFNDDEWFPPGTEREERITRLEGELRTRRLDVIMSIKCRADDVQEALFCRLLAMGVVRAYVGVESGSEHSLRTLHKRTTVAQNRHALQVLQRVGMLADFGLIFFDPDSTLDDVRANLAFFREMAGAGQAPLSFGRLEVYAGTPILRRLQAEGRLTGDYMAWDYAIPDARVEMLFRLMIVALRHRHYDNDGAAKQCSVACYEQMMYRYRLGQRANPALAQELRAMVARLNNHSLALLEEMLAFTLQEDIYAVAQVNERAAEWASRANLFDMQLLAELAALRERVVEDVGG
jgi:anaerobic magnesium-protoporphyrin IX monomethyl ester cyclase